MVFLMFWSFLQVLDLYILAVFEQFRLPKTQKPGNVKNRSSTLITVRYVQYRACMGKSSLFNQEYCLAFQGDAGIHYVSLFSDNNYD